MDFNVNAPILFVLVGIIVAFVLAQSAFFLWRAVNRAREIGLPQETIRKTISAAAVFTVAPAVAILVGVISLSKSLGIALPWLRLSVVGSLTYETVAAGTSLTELGLDTNTPIPTASDYVTVAAVMTVGIMVGLVLVPLLTKRIQGGMMKLGAKDHRWADIFNNAMFLGMISAFLGYVFSDVMNVTHGDFSGLIPVLVMLTSAVVMVICGVAAMRTKKRWIQDYALPISMLCGMAVSIPLTPLLSSPILAPAFSQILPALFGGLAVVFVSKNFRLALAPLLLMLVLFIFVPALNASTVGIMVPVGVIFSLVVARILYKKGLV